MEPENIERVFLPTEEIKLPDMIVLQPFVKTFYFKYIGPGETVNIKLSGRPATTGITADMVVHEADGLYSVRIHGNPREINKNDLTLRLSDDRGNKTEFPISFNVQGLEIQKTKLPDATGLHKEYITKIFFNNPSDRKPKFYYNFPVEFGRVFTEDDNGADYTTIRFYPTLAGSYKFYMEALCDADQTDGDSKDILLGARTLHIKVIDDTAKQEAGKIEDVKSVDIKDWK